MQTPEQVVRQYVETFNAGDLEGLRELFSPDALIHGVLGWGAVDAVMPIWKQLVDGLAIELRIEEMVAVEGSVAVRLVERGTSRAPFFDKPATGRSYELLAMEWFHVVEGKIHRRWGARDAASQARQLGWEEPATRPGAQPASRG